MTLELDVINAMNGEYARACEKHGKYNNSPHESYAVILEEYEEAQEEAERFGLALGRFWGAVRSNSATGGILEAMQELAEKAAAEWVQVAAMCLKASGAGMAGLPMTESEAIE